MGDGPERGYLKSLAAELELESVVEFSGAYVRSEFAEALSLSDVFVLASRRETFGVVYIEAMACGVPVIATRCGGPEDFVNGLNGLLVPVEDVESLAKAMLEIRENIKNYNRDIISNTAREGFAAYKIAERLTAIFEGLIYEIKKAYII
jgi:glycosyltransferase involved in cell wall biosynthesis